jgi:hypothetical protein
VCIHGKSTTTRYEMVSNVNNWWCLPELLLSSVKFKHIGRGTPRCSFVNFFSLFGLLVCNDLSAILKDKAIFVDMGTGFDA